MSLNKLSNDTTRQLDNTYYGVLEKLSMLQSTITSLKELALMTKQLNEDFKAEAEGVVEEVETSLDAVHGFEEQQTKIKGLAERVRIGREKVQSLGKRVDDVKDRVDGWEKAEWEWQEKTRKRMRILWGMMVLVLAIVVGVSIFQYTPARTQGPGMLKGMNVTGLLGEVPDLEKMKNESWSLKRDGVDALKKMREDSREKEMLEEDPRLRLFDEL
jgi:hypothetical protein